MTEYGRERNQSGIDGESARGSERLGFFAHELRNLMNTALMAFEVLETGNVGVAGSTGTVLHRTLMASHALITRSLAEVRLTQGIQNREQFLVAGFTEEIASAATLDANARGVRLTVMPVEDEVTIEDECGGLPSGDVNELFRPFEQRSAAAGSCGRRRSVLKLQSAAL